MILGIGGGGDVVGAISLAREIEAAGGEAEVGGVAWERFSVDPNHPGPRPLSDLHGIERIGSSDAALCSAEGRTPEGTPLAEAGVAAHLGRPTVLIDVNGGPRRTAAAIAAAAERLGCDLVIFFDVGGDVFGTGAEPGLASPLCDAVMLAADRFLPTELRTLGCVFGAGCDGELTGAEVLGRVARLAGDGGWLATMSPSPTVARELVEVAALVPTEASLMAARSGLGEIGPAPIRGGRRSVELGPLAALSFLFDPEIAVGGAAPLAEIVATCSSIEEARAALAAIGVATELDYERRRFAEAAAGEAAP